MSYFSYGFYIFIIVPEQSEDIVSALMLQSEVKGNIENASRYFDTTNVNRFKQLDLLLMTQGWRDFVWRRLADTAIRISYAAEDGISIPGRVRDEVLNKMMPNLNISLHADGAKGAKLFSSTTNSEGRFHFDGLMLYGKQNIQLSSTDGKGKDKGSFMVDTVLPLLVNPHISRPAGLQNSVDSAATAAVEKRVEIMKSASLHGFTKLKEVTINDKKRVITRSGDMLMTWGPDQVFNITPNDYQYKTLEWFLLKNVKGATKGSLYYQKGIGYTTVPDNHLLLQNPAMPVSGVFFSGMDTVKRKIPIISGFATSYITKNTLIPPIIFVDDRELMMNYFETAETYRNIYFSISINKLKKIVVRHLTGNVRGVTESGAALDPTAQNSTVDRYVIYLTLDENAMTDNPGMLIKDITGYYEARTFYTPPPNAKPSPADYRTTIYWEPNIKTDAMGKAMVSYYNALPQTNVRVIVQGITDTGVPLVSTMKYEVK